MKLSKKLKMIRSPIGLKLIVMSHGSSNSSYTKIAKNHIQTIKLI